MRIPYATLADCSSCCKVFALAGRLVQADHDMSHGKFFHIGIKLNCYHALERILPRAQGGETYVLIGHANVLTH